MVERYYLLFHGLKIGMKEETLVNGTMHRIMENTKQDTLAFKTMVVIFLLEM